MAQILDERQKTILRDIVHHFVLTANPVGSQFLSGRSKLRMSPATIRNIMAELEAMGFIERPHTSAGRVPTDRGYRYYVDELMQSEELTEAEKSNVRELLRQVDDYDELLWESSRILCKILHQLAIVSLPPLSSGIFEQLEIVPLASNKLFIVLSIRSGLVKTIMMEVSSDVPHDRIRIIASILNERLAGLTLEEIRNSFAERVKDVRQLEGEVIARFALNAEKIFADFPGGVRAHVTGTQYILSQPEFHDPQTVRRLMDLLENEEGIAHVVENSLLQPVQRTEPLKLEAHVTIGREHTLRRLEPYGLVTASYSAGGINGTIGVLGPKRMPYNRILPTVCYVAECLSSIMS